MNKKSIRALVFDVETSGLIPKNKEGVKLEDMPHILQLSYVVFDTNGWKVVKSGDAYINVSQTVAISSKITELTGITRDMCDKGIPIQTALREFGREYMTCDIIVAHNINFDRQMIKIEILF